MLQEGLPSVCLSMFGSLFDDYTQKPGFNEEQLLILDVPNISNADNQNALNLLDELRRSPYIKNLSVTTGVPGNIRMNGLSHVLNSDKNTKIWVMLADTTFIETWVNSLVVIFIQQELVIRIILK